MKIYTKTGDKGYTSLIGGVKVRKNNIRLEAYGTTDELNSHIGLVRDNLSDEHLRNMLYDIQNNLFVIGSLLAAHPEKNKMQLPEINETDIEVLELEIDALTEKLPELTHFVLPGGHAFVSQCHIARTVCRRAERITVDLAENEPVAEIIIRYLNRLSDFLFTLCRWIAMQQNAEEVKWIPRKSE